MHIHININDFRLCSRAAACVCVCVLVDTLTYATMKWGKKLNKENQLCSQPMKSTILCLPTKEEADFLFPFLISRHQVVVSSPDSASVLATGMNRA